MSIYELEDIENALIDVREEMHSSDDTETDDYYSSIDWEETKRRRRWSAEKEEWHNRRYAELMSQKEQAQERFAHRFHNVLLTLLIGGLAAMTYSLFWG